MNFHNKTLAVIKAVNSNKTCVFCKSDIWLCASVSSRVPYIRLECLRSVPCRFSSSKLSLFRCHTFILSPRTLTLNSHRVLSFDRSDGWIFMRPWILFGFRTDLGLDRSCVVTCNHSWILCWFKVVEGCVTLNLLLKILDLWKYKFLDRRCSAKLCIKTRLFFTGNNLRVFCIQSADAV